MPNPIDFNDLIQEYKEKSATIKKSTNAQPLDREYVEKKINGIQNKIASMNGQIILNLNQSIFNNIQH